MPMGSWNAPPPRVERRAVRRDHTVDVTYPGGIETAVLVAHDADSAQLRFVHRTAFTAFAEANARYDYRISVRSTGSAHGEYRFLDLTKLDGGALLVTLQRALHHVARNVDIGAECRFGDRVTTGVITAMSAVGGTLRLPDVEPGSDTAVISFELQGTRFELPSDIEHSRHDLVTLAFRPLTAEPLEALAGILRVTPPMAGHLSLGYISQHLVKERVARTELEAAQRAAEAEAARQQDPDRASRAEGLRHRVLWERLAPQRVITTPG